MLPFTAWPLSLEFLGQGPDCSLLGLHIVLPSLQLLRAFCTCAWPLAALAVALAYAKYSFRKDLSSLAGWSPSLLS